MSKFHAATYRRAVILLATNPRNAEYPTTEILGFSGNLFRVTFEKLMRDIKRYMEKSGTSSGWQLTALNPETFQTHTDSPDFRDWWKRNIGDLPAPEEDL